MENAMKQSSVSASTGSARWADLLITSVKVAVVGFVVLQGKEYVDAGSFDTPATALDAGLIAAGVFVLNAILKLVKI
jgi:hypothetical protein